ncbi:hypothetical protein MtrunA17_Chr7g0258461 [Medicago truncatula]|uniref:Uncharacterized protein n=1 Tax=Medicago truncatula TaxID=3880 RepID=A2Q4T5_MEDTR|nr:hypothetical protein MtrDRAFT_AC157891g3v2 [Medicago truncatula]RHN47945.1 hypothetical protein MtrunA17_Chr7g0258461 [Medicago truncatula]
MEYSKKVLDDLASLANLKKLKDEQELLKPDLLSSLKRKLDAEENILAKEDENIAKEIFSKKREEVHRISDEEFENSHKKMDNMHVGGKRAKA